MNVPDFLHPRKEPGTSVYLGVIMVIVAVTAFGLGRLSSLRNPESGLRVIYPEGMAEERIVTTAAVAQSVGGTVSVSMGANGEQIVASKSGSKYHFTWCSGAKSIKEENKVYFASTGEARATGYEPASNCKGLE